MLRPGSPSALEAQARIDREIAELNLAICRLRTQRNTLSLVSRLPPEVLSTVFIHYVLICHESTIRRENRVPLWVDISYVCRHWRDVALNCPTLWAYLNAASRSWIEALILRSRTSPLRILASGTFPEPIGDHTRRIQKLKLEGLRPWQVSNIFRKLSSPAPLLQSLEIEVEANSTWYASDDIPRVPLFGGDTPALRQVEFSNCLVALSPSMVAGITTLTLRNLGQPIQPTITELKAILSPMHNLVHLELDRAIPSSCSGPTNGSENLHFPRLLRLVITEPLSAVVVNLLCGLDIPLNTEVRLRFLMPLGYDTVDDDYAPLHPFLATRFHMSAGGNQPPPAIRSLSMRHGLNDNEVALIFSATENDCDHSLKTPDWGCNIPLNLGLYVSDAKAELAVVKNICRSVPLTRLRHVSFSLDVFNDRCSTLWEDFLGPLPELLFIHLVGARVSLGCLLSLLSCTRHNPPTNQDENNAREDELALIPLPALEELSFHGARFLREAGEHAPHTGATVSSLYEALSMRKDKGHNIQIITLEKCRNLFKDDVEKVKGVVDEVFWDGVAEEDVPETEDEDEGEDEGEDEDEDEDEDDDDDSGWGDYYYY